MAESMIHFSTVRSLQPPTNLSTLCQDGNAGPTQVPTNDDFQHPESDGRIQQDVDETLPQVAIIMKNQQQ